MFTSADGTYRKNGPWERQRRGLWVVVESAPESYVTEYRLYLEARSKMTAEQVAEERRQERSRTVESDWADAEQLNFIHDAWDPESREEKQHLFRIDGRRVDSGEMVLLCAERFGWTGRVVTLYGRLLRCLKDSGRRVYDFAPRSGNGKPGGASHVPASLADLEDEVL